VRAGSSHDQKADLDPPGRPPVGVVVVEHCDRLGSMNTELVEAALAAHGRRLVVVDDSEVTGDLIRDMIEVLTAFCGRPYGRRPARNRALEAVGCARRASARRPC
jgi:putative resolvase